jgi:hypothetical protein
VPSEQVRRMCVPERDRHAVLTAQRVRRKEVEMAAGGRCPTCWLPRHSCICAAMPHKLRFRLNVEFIVYMHSVELYNAANSAKILQVAAPERTSLYVHGREGDDERLYDWHFVLPLLYHRLSHAVGARTKVPLVSYISYCHWLAAAWGTIMRAAFACMSQAGCAHASRNGPIGCRQHQRQRPPSSALQHVAALPGRDCAEHFRGQDHTPLLRAARRQQRQRRPARHSERGAPPRPFSKR